MSEPATAPTAVDRPSRARSFSAVACLVIAALLTVPAAVAFWGQRTINDGQRYIDTVGPLVDSPEVQAAVATKVSDAIQAQVDVEALIHQVFAGVITDRPKLEALVGPLAGAVNGLIDSQVREFVASDSFADTWRAANIRAQEALLRILKGDDSGAVTIEGDQVVLDVSDVIDQVKQRLVDRGLTVLDRVQIPDQDRQIVLLTSPELDQLRTIYAFTNPVARWMLPLIAVLYLAALLLAIRRPKMTVAIGVALALNSLLVALALSIGRQLFINDLSGTVFGPASTVFYDQLLSYLERGQQVLLRLGLILVIIGWFAGRTKTGTATRRFVSGGLENVGAVLADGPVGVAGRWVKLNAVWLRIAVGLLAVVVLLWGNNVSQSRLYWSAFLVLVLMAVIQVLVGAGRGSSISATADPSGGPDGAPNDPTEPVVGSTKGAGA
jgi:hypothetical protein